MDLDTTLAEIENAQLVRRLDEFDPAYFFKHNLTQETAYHSLLLKKRREIHRRVAETIEQFYPDQLDEYAGRLAQHYAQAGDDAKTLEYATRAGDASAPTYANAETLASYALAIQSAIRLNAPTEQLSAVYLKRGRVLEHSGRYDEALANYQEMQRLAHERG